MKLRVNLHPNLRLSATAWILLALMAVGLVVAIVRFALGIGAISNLSNTYPWGFWISFDIFTGIAIASGAFILAALVYIFEIEAFRPLLMPSILTALLGYIMEVLALFVDLGRPERIWHMLIYQNYTSTMLVIGLCVMIYLAVLAALFAPVVFDGFKLPKYAEAFRRFAKPLVIFAVVISTIHQASLGALMLIQPTKLHPLWWSGWLPALFFFSALPIGLAMIIFESSLSSRYFNHVLETAALEKLARAIPYALGFYLLLKFAEMAFDGELGLLFSSGSMSLLFWIEILVGCLIPMWMFSSNAVRKNPSKLLTAAIILLLGMILNRFNVSWLAVKHLGDMTYVPSLVEISISVAIFSAGIVGFGLANQHLPLTKHEEHYEAHAAD
ncbi:MAG: Ni/Fe-hydrogenase cytochrome b subunit [Chloroflexi bacterium]|nr:Ni/Fe-hydrogenase cytochrome b subunit [Chloroflexota bacterium]